LVLPGTGNSFVASNEGTEVQSTSIDAYLNGKAASVIKADVEGSEPSLIRGAAQTIARFRPKMLISAYHEIEHLHELPSLIRAIRPDYSLGLRNHMWTTAKDSWPGSFFCETVIYAY
jgi:hypothetical protein